MIPRGVGLWMARAGLGACGLQIHWIHAGEEESGLPALWVSGAGSEAARARWLGLELRHKAGTSLVPGCVTHPSRGRRFPRQVSSEAEHPVNLSDDTKQRNALLSGQEGGGQPQRPEHHLFLLWRRGSEVLLSGKRLQNSVLKALAPSSSVRGLSALLPGHLSRVLCQALLFPWVPPCCLTKATTVSLSSGNQTPFFLVPACVNTCVIILILCLLPFSACCGLFSSGRSLFLVSFSPCPALIALPFREGKCRTLARGESPRP